MSAPVIRQFLGTIPDKGQAQTAFDTNFDAFLDWQALQFAPDLVAFGAFAQTTAAALVAGNLPPLTGQALDAVRVNAAADGVEFVDVTAQGWTFLAATTTAAQRTALEIPAPVELTQAQVENALGTVFGIVSGQRLKQAAAAAGWVSHGAFATTSGTSIDITGIPTGAKRINIFFDLVSGNGADDFLVQVGTGGTPLATGYTGGAGEAGASIRESATTGFFVIANDASDVLTGRMGLVKHPTTNVWVQDHSIFHKTNGQSSTGGGRVLLGGLINMIRLTFQNGSQLFDGGSVFVEYQL